MATDDTVLDELEVALSVLHQTAQVVDARRTQAKAELLDLLMCTGVEPTSTNYERCLFCNYEYGYTKDASKSYDTITAVCGCEGIGWKCAIDGEKHHPKSCFKCFGCSMDNQNPPPACYKCRRLAHAK